LCLEGLTLVRRAPLPSPLVLTPTSVLTSHDFARNNIDRLADLRWSVIIVDEAHRLKNPASATTQNMHLFEHGVRFGLTVRPFCYFVRSISDNAIIVGHCYPEQV
jgi:SNF2 family DNA or RNA helicase